MSENAILAGLEYEVAAGRLSFKGVRYLLARPETLVALQLAVEAEVGPEKCARLMQAAGFTGGALSARRYREAFGYSDREVAEFMCCMGGEIGWGRFTLARLDVTGQEMVVEVEDSPFAEAYLALVPSPPLSGGEGVCHLIRGVLAGLGAGLFGGEVTARETACRARADVVCRFEVRGR